MILRQGCFLADRYEIVEQIGTGGMADVYKAKDHKLNRYVAIKVMKSEFSEDSTFIKKFRAEAQAAAGLMHNNVVNVYDVGDENGMYYIVMELVEGITLKKYIEKRGKIPYKEAASIAIQVANGMAAAHEAHIIHRDIKPQNIIISKEGKVKVTDFGIAKAASSSTINSSSTMGSVHYISPEQARGGYSDERSDIYSLGVTMFEMLTGMVPFDGDSSVAVAVRHIQDEIPAPSTVVDDIPISIDRIVIKCTQKKTERRYQKAKDLVEDLKKSLITPNEDFVKMPPMYNEDSKAKADAMAAALATAMTNGKPRTAYAEENDDEFLDDEEYDDRDDDFDENDDEFFEEDDDLFEDDSKVASTGDPKLDKAMKYIGIGIAVVILGIVIFMLVRLFSNSSSSSSNTTTAATTTKGATNAATKEQVVVPDVTGKTFDDAVKALNDVGLGYKKVVEASDTVDEGKVIKQSVIAGQTADKNSQITLTVSSGKTTKAAVTIPDVKKVTEENAKNTLKTAGFDVTVEYEYSSTVDQGLVISYTPTGSAQEGSTITLKVSQGPESFKMSSLAGKSESNARQWISEAGLNIGTVTYQETSDSSQVGVVITQTPVSGSSVKKGDTVTLIIGKEKTTAAAAADTATTTAKGSN